MGNKNILVVVLVALVASLVGGGVVAMLMGGGKAVEEGVSQVDVAVVGELAGLGEEVLPEVVDLDDAAEVVVEPVVDVVQYAEVVRVEPISQSQKVYATVTNVEPVYETVRASVPHEVCEDVVVQERLAERDGNVGGTVAGAAVGGLAGNQLGKGSGRKVATVAGAVIGGLVGNQIDRNHEGGKVVERIERQCRTEMQVSESSNVTGYSVSYRNADGTTGTKQMASRPGERFETGTSRKVTGYKVTYRFQGVEKTMNMNERPQGDRLAVVDGQLITQSTAIGR